MTGIPAAAIARARETIGPPPSSFTPWAPASLTNRMALWTAPSSLSWNAPRGMSTRKNACFVVRRAARASMTISSMLIGVVSA